VSTIQTWGIVAAVASAIVAGIFGLIRLAVRDVTKAAEQRGRDEVIKESQREEIDAQSRAGSVLAERRTVDDTTRRLSDGNF
jgi:Na+-translocating ferredoxin:NAD+ oxidoreductase RnfG subunit